MVLFLPFSSYIFEKRYATIYSLRRCRTKRYASSMPAYYWHTTQPLDPIEILLGELDKAALLQQRPKMINLETTAADISTIPAPKRRQPNNVSSGSNILRVPCKMNKFNYM